MMNKKNSDIDARQVLSTCYKCEAAPNKSCTECGNLFCSDHGGEGYIFKHTNDGISLKKEVICDNCTPNQTIMSIIKYILINIVVLIIIFIVVMVTSFFSSIDDSISSQPATEEPVPVEPLEPAK